jgi:hypothetical protein
MSKETADFLAQEQQYLRDRARLDVHRLALKDDEFGCLAEQVRTEVRAHTRYLQERGVPIILHDHDRLRITVENTDRLRLAVFTFNAVHHVADVRGAGVHHVFEVAIDHDYKSVVIGRKFGQSLGTVDNDKIVDAVRNAIDSIT